MIHLRYQHDRWQKKGKAYGAVLYAAMYVQPQISVEWAKQEVAEQVQRKVRWAHIGMPTRSRLILVEADVWTPCAEREYHNKEIPVAPLQAVARENAQRLRGLEKEIYLALQQGPYHYNALIYKHGKGTLRAIHELQQKLVVDINGEKLVYQFGDYTWSDMSQGMKLAACVVHKKHVSRSEIVDAVKATSETKRPFWGLIAKGVIRRKKEGKETYYVWRGFRASK